MASSMGKDPDDLGTSHNNLIQVFNRVAAMELGQVLKRVGPLGQDIVLALIYEVGQLGRAGAELLGTRCKVSQADERSGWSETWRIKASTTVCWPREAWVRALRAMTMPGWNLLGRARTTCPNASALGTRYKDTKRRVS